MEKNEVWENIKKYAKVLSTYIDGMFTKTDEWVLEDPKTHIIMIHSPD